MARSDEITQLLAAHQEGDPEAFARLVPLVYEDLRGIAHARLAGHRRGSLDTTGLVHEAYLKLVARTAVSWQSRAHFFSVAARAMRQIVVDFARRHRALKRGRAEVHVPLDEAEIAIEEEAEELLLLDQAVERLSEIGERLGRVVECRFFGGFTDEETAEALGVSVRTVQRDWSRARAWLRHELASGSADSG